MEVVTGGTWLSFQPTLDVTGHKFVSLEDTNLTQELGWSLDFKASW